MNHTLNIQGVRIMTITFAFWILFIILVISFGSLRNYIAAWANRILKEQDLHAEKAAEIATERYLKVLELLSKNRR